MRWQVMDPDVKQEPIELSFRQRIGALHLNRVLSREHKERRLQQIALACGRNLMFLHRFQ